MIYTNKSFLNGHKITSASDLEKLSSKAQFWIFDLAESDRKLEVADKNKNLPYSLWQFSWAGALSGTYTQAIDVDVFKGTDSEFQSKFLTKN
jgi:GH25 family lysozyme M1 (1,4-beta-N-acetylmuramidase)